MKEEIKIENFIQRIKDKRAFSIFFWDSKMVGREVAHLRIVFPIQLIDYIESLPTEYGFRWLKEHIARRFYNKYGVPKVFKEYEIEDETKTIFTPTMTLVESFLPPTNK